MVLERILDHLRDLGNPQVEGYRSDFLREAVQRRIEASDSGTWEAYLDRLRSTPGEAELLLGELEVGVSWFFRSPLTFAILERVVLPLLVEEKRTQTSGEFRVWSAGCSGGDEAWSLAMLLHRILDEDRKQWSPLVIATDVDEQALAQGERGVFPRERLGRVPLEFLDRYTQPCPGGYSMAEELRGMVCFSRDDLTSIELVGPVASIFGSFDLILCQNVLIYFDSAWQERILARLTRALVPGGFLCLGDCEGVEAATRHLSCFDERSRVFRKPRAAAVGRGVRT